MAACSLRFNAGYQLIGFSSRCWDWLFYGRIVVTHHRRPALKIAFDHKRSSADAAISNAKPGWLVIENNVDIGT
jgi:hypothetical protein